MYDKTYYAKDNILTALTINSSLNNQFQSTTLTSFDSSTFALEYNHLYPTITDATVYQPANVITAVDKVTFLPDTTTIVDFVLFDDYMNLCCNTLCSDDYKFKLQSFDLVLAGHIDGVYQNKVVFFHNQKNPLTNNVIYDYIEDIGGSTLYNNKRQNLLAKRELVGYIDESEFPEYVIKCIDSTGGITYKNIFLSDYGYTPVSGILTSSFYKVDTTNSGTLTDDLWRSCKTLSILFSTSQFSTWLQTLRESYSEVRLLLKIKNWSGTNNAVMYKAENNFVQYRGCTFYQNGEFQDVTSLVDFDQWFLNRGVYLKYSSSDIEGIIKENNNVVFQLNDVSFQPENYIYDKTILIGNNEALINNVKTYIPFEMYKTEPNVISVSIKDQNTSFLFKMNKQMNITLMRHSNTTMGMSNHYNPTDTVIAFDNFKYLSASERSDITNTEIVQPLLITSKFNSNKNNVYSISKSDITSIFDGIDNDLSINVFQRKFAQTKTYLYIQFKKEASTEYLKKYITADIIDLVLNNIIISITQMELSSNKLQLSLQKPEDRYINKYADESGTITYMYLIDNKEILSINGVYNRVAIEENSIKHTTTENYYMPNDVVFIDNNKA